MGSQQELEDIVEWYVRPLGLDHYRMEVRWNDTSNELHDGDKSDGFSWASESYPIAVVGVRPPDRCAIWKHDVVECVAVHELVHIIVEPVRRMYLDLLDEMDLPGKARNTLYQAFERRLEHTVETLSIALVAVSQADRNGPAPSIGGIVKREEAA